MVELHSRPPNCVAMKAGSPTLCQVLKVFDYIEITRKPRRSLFREVIVAKSGMITFFDTNQPQPSDLSSPSCPDFPCRLRELSADTWYGS
jgi:hypothetical protein